MNRPDWPRINGVFAKPDDGDLVQVTKQTLRLALSALREANARDAYHNFMAAEREIAEIVGELK